MSTAARTTRDAHARIMPDPAFRHRTRRGGHPAAHPPSHCAPHRSTAHRDPATAPPAGPSRTTGPPRTPPEHYAPHQSTAHPIRAPRPHRWGARSTRGVRGRPRGRGRPMGNVVAHPARPRPATGHAAHASPDAHPVEPRAPRAGHCAPRRWVRSPHVGCAANTRGARATTVGAPAVAPGRHRPPAGDVDAHHARPARAADARHDRPGRPRAGPRTLASQRAVRRATAHPIRAPRTPPVGCAVPRGVRGPHIGRPTGGTHRRAIDGGARSARRGRRRRARGPPVPGGCARQRSTAGKRGLVVEGPDHRRGERLGEQLAGERGDVLRRDGGDPVEALADRALVAVVELGAADPVHPRRRVLQPQHQPTAQVALRAGDLGRGQPVRRDLGEDGADDRDDLLQPLRRAPGVHAERARVGVGHRGRVHRVRQPALLPDLLEQPRARAAAERGVEHRERTAPRVVPGKARARRAARAPARCPPSAARAAGSA